MKMRNRVAISKKFDANDLITSETLAEAGIVCDLMPFRCPNCKTVLFLNPAFFTMYLPLSATSETHSSTILPVTQY